MKASFATQTFGAHTFRPATMRGVIVVVPYVPAMDRIILPIQALVTGLSVLSVSFVTGITIPEGSLGVAITGYTINTGVSGDNFDITVPIPGVPIGQTLTKAWFTAKADPLSSDVNAVVSKIVTSAPSAAGQITDDGSTDLEGVVVFSLTPANMSDIYNLGPLTFDIQVLTSSGKIFTYMTMCTISALQEVTFATS